jgi:predicted molibdopterin-dependent oxidoreductase YjgC
VKVGGETVRSCMTPVEDGMQVTLPAQLTRAGAER